MKRLISLTLALLTSISAAFAKGDIDIHFSEGVDLMGVVFRLAGAKEFQCKNAPKYYESLDAYFASYKDHPITEYVRECRKHASICYDAVSAYGQHLVIGEDGKIAFDNREAKGSDTSFSRWPDDIAEEFLPKLEQFYKDTDFHTWYVSTEAFREKAIAAFRNCVDEIDFDWFDEYFYGNAIATEKAVVLSILIGPNNFGNSMALQDGGEFLCPVIGSCHEDEDGNPHYEDIAGIIVHEFCHHYCNPLDEKHWSLMKKGAAKAFKPMKTRLTESAYPSPGIMQNETFVRSSVIRYLLSHDPSADKDRLIVAEENLGFLLTRTEVDVLNEYEASRDQYKDMEAFMPRLGDAINAFTTAKYQKLLKEVSADLATYTCNIKDGSRKVPSGDFRIEITFSEPMEGDVSICYPDGDFDLPEVKDASWSDDMKTLRLDVVNEPGKDYGFRIEGSGFTTKSGRYAVGEKEIHYYCKR